MLGSRVRPARRLGRPGPGVALVRPESVRVTPADSGADGADGAAANARVVSVAFLGPFSRVQCRLDDGQVVVAQTTSSLATRLSADAAVHVDVEPDAVLVVPR